MNSAPTNAERTAMLRQLGISTLISWPMMQLYLFINHNHGPNFTVVEMPSWVPFWPWMLPVYLLLLWVTWLLPVWIRDAAKFRACMLANVIAWALITPWWILFPTHMPRPILPEGIWTASFEWMWKMDEPFNITPCAHGSGPMVAAWFLGKDRPNRRWIWMLLVLLALPSIAFVWQHRPIDILLGCIAAVIGITAAEFHQARSSRRQNQ